MDTTTHRRRTSRGSVIAAAAFLGVGALAAFAPSVAEAGGDPRGANGTVKIDGVEFDTAPNNEPHVGCGFQVDFYGFDQGAYDAAVDFSVQPPTGPNVSILTDSVFIGEDAAGGGVDLDAEKTYDLSAGLSALTPHPQQGYHVKLTVTAPGANGKVATKHKVFWAQACEAPPCEQTSSPTGECDN